MAKAHYAVYLTGTNTLWISPDAVIVSKKAGKVLIRNYTGKEFPVSGAIAGRLFVQKKAQPFSLAGLAEDVYTFDLGKGRKRARAPLVANADH